MVSRLGRYCRHWFQDIRFQREASATGRQALPDIARRHAPADGWPRKENLATATLTRCKEMRREPTNLACIFIAYPFHCFKWWCPLALEELSFQRIVSPSVWEVFGHYLRNALKELFNWRAAIYPENPQNWSDFGHVLLILNIWHNFDLVERIKFEASGHFLFVTVCWFS